MTFLISHDHSFCTYLSSINAEVVGFPSCYKTGRTAGSGSQAFGHLENNKIQVNTVVERGLLLFCQDYHSRGKNYFV